ncbi:MAG: DoxX family protein [Woeseiaceae bacterium]
MNKYNSLIARILLAHIFVLAGMNKIMGYAGTQGYMEAMGVPSILLPLVIGLELAGGLALVIGWQTRYIAYALAGFSIVSAIIFHNNLAEQAQMIMFMKNLAIAGGLMLLAEHGAGALSLENKK